MITWPRLTIILPLILCLACTTLEPTNLWFDFLVSIIKDAFFSSASSVS
jgi:hypothetical protein